MSDTPSLAARNASSIFLGPRVSAFLRKMARPSLKAPAFELQVILPRSTVRYTLGPVGSTLTNGFGTRKRSTPRRVLLPESGSTEIAARIGECVAPSCAHAVVVHSTVAVTASGRRMMYFLILALIC